MRLAPPGGQVRRMPVSRPRIPVEIALMKTKIISAVCTLMHDDDSLHVEGMRCHVANQWDEGIAGILVAGTMGRMQMLGDATYRQLVETAAAMRSGDRAGSRGEVLVGVGDVSFPRTRDRTSPARSIDRDGPAARRGDAVPRGQGIQPGGARVVRWPRLRDRRTETGLLQRAPGRCVRDEARSAV